MTASDLIWVMTGIGIGLVVSMAALSVLVALESRRLRRRATRRPMPVATPVERPVAAAPLAAALPPADAIHPAVDDSGQDTEATAAEEPETSPPQPPEADSASEPVPPVETAKEPLTVETLFAEAFRADIPAGEALQTEVARAEWRPAKPRSQQSKNEDADELPKP